MNRVQSWIYGRWAIPAVSGVLILASFAASEVAGSQPWADVLMLAAAVVAGYGIVVKAVRALMVRSIGVCSSRLPRSGRSSSATTGRPPR